MGHCGRQRVLERFTVGRMTRATLEVYEQAMRGSRKGVCA